MTSGAIIVVAAFAVGLSVLVWPKGRAADGRSLLARLRDRLRHRRVAALLRGRLERELPAVLAATAAGLRAGLGTGTALAVAAEHAAPTSPTAPDPAGDADPWSGLIAAAHAGAMVAPAWRSLAERSDNEDVALVAGAWELTEVGGTQLVEALGALLALLDQRARHRRAVRIARAGPRASVRVLLLLPLSGPVVALAFGIDPLRMYLGTPMSIVSVIVGIGFAAVGSAWTHRLLAGRLR